MIRSNSVGEAVTINNTMCVAKNKTDDYLQPRFQNMHKKVREKKLSARLSGTVYLPT